eukprot:TRINITY_DN17823_c0_g2_i1.p1 TRINITY_DN17823_c0_g2~~TRINITY_DN17823_c0_g2_i1.p1  ORF type:complete len:119 (-),score=37.52 TRINITY_DN17823_c0_g2_i1:98-454(-)
MRDRETRKMNEYNTRFSLDRTSSSGSPTTNDNNPGVGYLMAAVSATGQAAASVCSNGFNQAAALAACRSIGYTPGPNALYTVTTAKPSTYTCLLYTSDAADEEDSVDLGGRRIIKKKN